MDTKVEINSNLCWRWKNEFIPLNRLHSRQLDYIRNFIGNNPKDYFNVTEMEWQVNIKHLLNVRRIGDSIDSQIRLSKRSPLQSGANLVVNLG